MTINEIVESTLADSGVPVARMSWGPAVPNGPYAIYSRINGGHQFGDNSNYGLVPRYATTLYLDAYNEDIISRYEACVSKLGTWTRTDDFSERHNRLIFTWTFSFVHQLEAVC